MTGLWEFVGWLLFGDHVTVSLPLLLWHVVIGWWLRGYLDERRLRKAWLAAYRSEGGGTGG